MTRTIKAGSEALLVYPEGDCDRVIVLSLTRLATTVRVKGTDKVITTVPEDIGVFVDDRLVPQFDSETCSHIQCRTRQDRQDLQCSRRAGHEGTHFHSTALGWCSARFEKLTSGGRAGGHRHPVA